MLEDWDTSIERGVSKTKLRELSSLDFWELKRNLIIVGPTGSGKTHLSMAIGRAACQHQLSVTFMSINQLFEEMQAQRSAGKYLSWSKKLKKIDLLIFDDFGLRSFSHEESMFFIDLLEDRYQNKGHIFTSQVDIEGWKDLYEDPIARSAESGHSIRRYVLRKMSCI